MGDIALNEFSDETWYVISMAPSEEKVYWYQLGITYGRVHAVKIYDGMAFGAGIAR